MQNNITHDIQAGRPGNCTCTCSCTCVYTVPRARANLTMHVISRREHYLLVENLSYRYLFTCYELVKIISMPKEARMPKEAQPSMPKEAQPFNQPKLLISLHGEVVIAKQNLTKLHKHGNAFESISPLLLVSLSLCNVA